MSNISDVLNNKMSNKKDRKELREAADDFQRCMLSIQDDCTDANNCRRIADNIDKLKNIRAKIEAVSGYIDKMIGILERYKE